MFSWRTQKLILSLLTSCLLFISSISFSQDLFVDVHQVREDNGFLEVHFQVRNPFQGELLSHLERGVPCTISYSIDVWKKRSGWFDQLVGSKLLFFRVHFDLWREGYAIQTLDGKLPTASSLEDLATTVADEQQTRVIPVAMLRPDSRYFLSIKAALTPLSVQDIEELENWMRGGKDKERGGQSGGSISRFFLRIAASFVGLGKKTTVVKTDTFTLDQLFDVQ
jgi:hypothetical protein